MPNWCNNAIEISGDDEQIDAFEQYLDDNKGKEWFNFFLPIPSEHKEGEKWYQWSIDNWGCKWNCDAQDWQREENTIRFWFDSPWGPPTVLYEKMTEEGFFIDAHYLEEGMSFVGRFVDGFDDYNEYDLEDPDSLDVISEEIVEYWNLRERQADWLAEQEEWDNENDDENK